MTTEAYRRLDDEHIDAIDAAIFSGDMFFDTWNRAAFRQMLSRWDKGLKDAEDIANQFAES